MLEEEKNNPIISIIVPVYNDLYGLKDTLGSLISQDYPENQFEIIVADNGSTDDTLVFAKEFAQKHQKIVKVVVENSVQSSYAARNKAIKASKGTIIAFIDADMSVEKNWLSKIDESLKKYNAKYLACNVKIYSKDTSIPAIYDKINGFPIEKYVKEINFSPTCCLVVNKEVFSELGLFDFRLISSGDYEFGKRVYGAGYSLHYEPNIFMMHPARTSLKSLLKKAFRIGRGHYQLSYYYPKKFPEKSMDILKIRSYLPISPHNYNQSMQEKILWNRATVTQKIGIYFVHWSFKLMINFGYIYEIFKKK